MKTIKQFLNLNSKLKYTLLTEHIIYNSDSINYTTLGMYVQEFLVNNKIKYKPACDGYPYKTPYMVRRVGTHYKSYIVYFNNQEEVTLFKLKFDNKEFILKEYE